MTCSTGCSIGWIYPAGRLKNAHGQNAKNSCPEPQLNFIGRNDDHRPRIQGRTEELEAEYLNLQELRKKAGLTQASVSRELDMPQSNVSRLEKSSDMLLSTLRAYVEAIGGKLHVTVELPGKPPIMLAGLGDLIEGPKQDDVKHVPS